MLLTSGDFGHVLPSATEHRSCFAPAIHTFSVLKHWMTRSLLLVNSPRKICLNLQNSSSVLISHWSSRALLISLQNPILLLVCFLSSPRFHYFSCPLWFVISAYSASSLYRFELVLLMTVGRREMYIILLLLNYARFYFCWRLQNRWLELWTDFLLLMHQNVVTAGSPGASMTFKYPLSYQQTLRYLSLQSAPLP